MYTEAFAYNMMVNYPLSKANGLPASQTSKPTILSTGVNLDSPCPILLFLSMLIRLNPSSQYILYLHYYLCHALLPQTGHTIPLTDRFLFLYFGIHKRNIADYWHKNLSI